MNEGKIPNDMRRFAPPNEGMLPGDSIVWSRKPGIGFWVIFFGALLLMVGPVVTLTSLDVFGLSVSVIFGIITLIGFIVLLDVLFNLRRTRYYLTTDRIIEVTCGRIKRVITLDHFTGRPLSQFLESRVTSGRDDHSVYGIRIYDPVSDEVIELKSLDTNSAKTFERIGETVECQYCGRPNSALRSQCKNFDAVM